MGFWGIWTDYAPTVCHALFIYIGAASEQCQFYFVSVKYHVVN